jgi:DNA-binding PadR family transcriptional regulator
LATWAPYTALALNESRLEANARLGLLRRGEGEYYLTEAGRTAVKRIIAAAYAAMAGLQPLPEADLSRLADLLHRLVEASLAAPEPPDKWRLHLSRRTDPGESAPIVTRIDQYLTDLNAYRDASHLAAWQPYGVSGAAWEAFTYLWRGEADTLEDLCTALARRGHPPEVYAQALTDLVARGWLTEEDGRYRLTPAGAALRQEAEEATDRYFYAPWTCLDEGELAELSDLLTGLRDGLAGQTK